MNSETPILYTQPAEIGKCLIPQRIIEFLSQSEKNRRHEDDAGDPAILEPPLAPVCSLFEINNPPITMLRLCKNDILSELYMQRVCKINRRWLTHCSKYFSHNQIIR